MMPAVPVFRPHDVRREWFDDARDDSRRMEVSWHHEEGLVIVSFWAGHLCRATFRMPARDAPDLIHLLVDAVAEAASAASSEQPKGRLTNVSDRGTQIIDLAQRRDAQDPEPLWLD
jgi:hypothetical protein